MRRFAVLFESIPDAMVAEVLSKRFVKKLKRVAPIYCCKSTRKC